MSNYEQLFSRIFLDTNIVHYLVRHGKQIFDNQYDDDELPNNDKIIKNIWALQNTIGLPRCNFRLVVSSNMIDEVVKKYNSRYTGYVFELKNYCDTMDEHSDLLVYHDHNQQILHAYCPKIGFLSIADKKLIFDAIRLRCTYFMTTDEKLMKNKSKIKDFTGISLISPFEFFNLVKPWLGLLI